MPLYVARPPDPPLGADWEATVPGQYLYDITGITAMLTNTQPTANVAADSSGNGNDGTYTGVGAGDPFVPGLVTGDLAVTFDGPVPADSVQGVSIPPSVIPPSSDFSFVMLWENIDAFPSHLYGINAIGSSGPPSALLFRFGDGVAESLSLSDGAFFTWQSVAGVIPFDNLPHLIGVVLQGAVVTFYVDGAAVANAVTAGTPATGTYDVLGINDDGAVSVAGDGTGDEAAFWSRALTAGEITGLQGARSDIIVYTTAVLALAPDAYYHLDDEPAQGGRQVTFDVTDGTDIVAEIPTGFARSTAAGPFSYSWQPKLSSSSQSADGTFTTTAIPRLILPAGYTVGTNTLDLAPADQWSDIVIWWDSALMDSINGVGAYEYPPGAHLVYKQVTNG